MTLLARVRGLVVGVLAFVGGGYLLMAYTPVANLLAAPLAGVTSEPRQADAIVVLSGGHYRDGTLNEAALERTITGVILYRQNLAPWLLFSGGPCCGRSTSALMARLALALGVPDSAVLLEEQSLRTHESAIRSAALLRSRDLRSAILVTGSLHLLRARLAFEATGLTVYPIRASGRNLRLVSSAVERLALLEAALHEYVGLAVYRARGWM